MSRSRAAHHLRSRDAENHLLDIHQRSPMSAQDVAQLQRTLGQAISLLGQTLPHVTDFDSDEALAWQVYGEQMTACVTSTAENPSPAQLVTEKQETTQHAERECSSCIEATRDQDLIVLKCCQTIFCKTCFRTWIETSLHGNTLPSCCGARISMGVYGKSLTVAMRRVYTRVEEELSADHKIHCGNERCGKIILVSLLNPLTLTPLTSVSSKTKPRPL